VRHVWDRYVNWGIANSKQRKALRSSSVGGSTKGLKHAGGAAHSSSSKHEFVTRLSSGSSNDLPVELI